MSTNSVLAGHHGVDISVGLRSFVEATAEQLHAVVGELPAQVSFADFGLGAGARQPPAPCEADDSDAAAPLPRTMKPGAVMEPGIMPSMSALAGVAPLRCVMTSRPSARRSFQAKLW